MPGISSLIEFHLTYHCIEQENSLTARTPNKSSMSTEARALTRGLRGVTRPVLATSYGQIVVHLRDTPDSLAWDPELV